MRDVVETTNDTSPEINKTTELLFTNGNKIAIIRVNGTGSSFTVGLKTEGCGTSVDFAFDIAKKRNYTFVGNV